MSRTLRTLMSVVFVVIAVLQINTLFAGTTPTAVYAADECITTPKGNNPVLNANSFTAPQVGCSDQGEPWLANLLRIVFGVMAMSSLLFVAIGAFKYTISGGSPEALKSAKNTIIYALLGLLLGISAFTIVNIVLGATS